MQGSVSGKVARVNCFTSGIGLGIARKLAAHGANLVVNGFGDIRDIDTMQTEIGKEFGMQTVITMPICRNRRK